VEQSATAASRTGHFVQPFYKCVFVLGDEDRGALRLIVKCAVYKYAYLLTCLCQIALSYDYLQTAVANFLNHIILGHASGNANIEFNLICMPNNYVTEHLDMAF